MSKHVSGKSTAIRRKQAEAKGEERAPALSKKSRRAQRRVERLGTRTYAPRGKPFVPGDPRIRSHQAKRVSMFQELRLLVQEILEEEGARADHPERGTQTRLEHLLRDLADNPGKDETIFSLLQFGYGNVPQEVKNYNYDVDKLLEKVDLTKLSNEQIQQLSEGKSLIEVLLGKYLPSG